MSFCILPTPLINPAVIRWSILKETLNKEHVDNGSKGEYIHIASTMFRPQEEGGLLLGG